MIARWKDLCIDASDAHRMARFWRELLGLEIDLHADGDAALRGATPDETIWINTVPEPRTVKQRVHLDLNVASVDPLLRLGASMVAPAGQSGFRWSQLADPEGGELCAFEREGMAASPPARLYEMVVDTASTESSHHQAEWWAGVWGRTAIHDERGFSYIEGVPGMPFEDIDFIPVPEPKTVKNRIHWDVSCDDVPGLVDRGARVLAEPTQATPWHVLADPDGNEFCAFASD